MARYLPLFVHSSIDDMTDLTPNAMRVYMHLTRRADADGVAWPSYQAVGDHCFKAVSDNPVTRKSFARRAIDELIEAGLVGKEAREREDGGQSSNGYRLTSTQDAPPVPIGTPMSIGTDMPIDTPVPNEQPPVPIGTPRAYKAPKNTPIEDSPNLEGSTASRPAKRGKARTPQQEMYGAICEALGWDYKTLTSEDKVRVAQAVKILDEAEYTVTDIRRFMVDVWFHDWRWEKFHQRPTLTQLRQEIGKLRADTPEPVPRASPNGTSKVASSLSAVDQYEQMKAKHGVTT